MISFALISCPAVVFTVELPSSWKTCTGAQPYFSAPVSARMYTSATEQSAPLPSFLHLSVTLKKVMYLWLFDHWNIARWIASLSDSAVMKSLPNMR